MGFIRQIGLPLGVLVILIVLLFLGFSSGQTGWVALALMCAWPLLFGVTAWTLRGLRDNYQLVPKPNNARRAARQQEILG